MDRIVVGVDGSEGSRAALEFAVHEAQLRRAALRLVCAWSVPSMAYSGGLVMSGDAGDVYREAAEHAVRVGCEAVAKIDPELECETVTVDGQPAHVLVEESRDATLLVVGTRGHGGFASLLLGSVSHQCAHHASCPVVIIPPAPAKPAPADR